MIFELHVRPEWADMCETVPIKGYDMITERCCQLVQRDGEIELAKLEVVICWCSRIADWYVLMNTMFDLRLFLLHPAVRNDGNDVLGDLLANRPEIYLHFFCRYYHLPVTVCSCFVDNRHPKMFIKFTAAQWRIHDSPRDVTQIQ